MRTALILVLLAASCSIPASDPQDRVGHVAVHLLAPLDSEFSTTKDLTGRESTPEELDSADWGYGVALEWGHDLDREAVHSYLFAVRSYEMEAKDEEGARNQGRALEFSFGMRNYPDLGFEDPWLQPFVGGEFVAMPLVDIGGADLWGLGAGVTLGADLWMSDYVGFETALRYVVVGIDLLRDAQMHRGWEFELGLVTWF